MTASVASPAATVPASPIANAAAWARMRLPSLAFEVGSVSASSVICWSAGAALWRASSSAFRPSTMRLTVRVASSAEAPSAVMSTIGPLVRSSL